ncbi:MAG: hypothetical protein GY795_37005 [Desulfobacterales bacterium]|nr:hypothetical protein [Desulfobacterales bacterium]
MENTIITPDVHTVITELANQLHIPETDVVRQAVHDYEKKIRNKKQLMPYTDSSMNKDDFWTALTVFRQNTSEEGVEITDSDFEKRCPHSQE